MTTDIFRYNLRHFRSDCTKVTDELRKGNPYLYLCDPGSSEVWFYFVTPERYRVKDVRLTITHRRTQNNGTVDILVNDDILKRNYDNLSKYEFSTQEFSVPKDFWECDENKVTVLLSKTSEGPYLISDAQVEVEYTDDKDLIFRLI